MLTTHSCTSRAYWRVVRPRALSPCPANRNWPTCVRSVSDTHRSSFALARSARTAPAVRSSSAEWSRDPWRSRWRNVIDADSDQIATAQLAVDRQVEQREVPLPTLDLQLGPDRPDVAWSQRWFGAD